ncbi:hypothetical protein PG997_015449 [Apiospora hydei]|uniref:UBR-type domain-containing protein n=1 Tax=Apiospora hydei TaxID=1337664 RepID=A0ABR1UQN2_9PEZI
MILGWDRVYRERFPAVQVPLVYMYERHSAHIRAIVPPESFLEFPVGSGWKSLASMIFCLRLVMRLVARARMNLYECGYNDKKVFCSDCSNTADHKDHGVEVVAAREDDEAYCDCGHSRAVEGPMTCARYGTMILEQ